MDGVFEKDSSVQVIAMNMSCGDIHILSALQKQQQQQVRFSQVGHVCHFPHEFLRSTSWMSTAPREPHSGEEGHEQHSIDMVLAAATHHTRRRRRRTSSTTRHGDRTLLLPRPSSSSCYSRKRSVGRGQTGLAECLGRRRRCLGHDRSWQCSWCRW